MTPHRIGPLLCATFLVLAGAASADQTWTTAWTPDSAPAARNNTRQEQDHSYKTNCYPCKRWVPGADSGRGAMINDPTNAAPRTCPGDTTETSSRRLSGNSQDTEPNEGENDETDYACKECDGMGGLTNKPDYTPCGTCGCCENGNCVEYTNNCPNPLPVLETSLNKTDPCPCTDPTAGGCVIPEILPIPPPMPEYSVCINNCNWVPVLESFTIDYKEGLCLDRCQNQIASADDVTPENVCAVKQALEDRINAILNPPPPQDEDEPPPPPEEDEPDELPPVEFCFTTCMQLHEDTHVEQIKEVWQEFSDSIYFTACTMSVPFTCDNMRTEELAKSAFEDDFQDLMIREYMDFIREWHARDLEPPAYGAEALCLQELLSQIQQMAIDQNCP